MHLKTFKRKFNFFSFFSWISEILKKTPISSIHIDVPKVVPKQLCSTLQKQDYELFHKLIHQNLWEKKKKKKKSQSP
jgi:hypothetical protein